MRALTTPAVALILTLGTGCADATAPATPGVSAPSVAVDAAWGPETPHFNLEAILRGDGFGLVKFRQPNDAEQVVHLDVFVRDLAANTSYRLQRAVDTSVDGICTSEAWLTLGRGAVPEAIVTDDRGTGRAELSRNIPAPVGTQFDIHFRVVQDGTGTAVLWSDCYEFTVSQ